MVTRLIAAGLAIALLGWPALGAAADTRAHSLADLAWMAGHWVMEDGDGRAEEIWTAPLDGSMVASFRWAIPGRMHVLEFLVIEERDGVVYFRFKHFDRDYRAWEMTPNTYRLASVEHRTATFENVDWNGKVPQFITYSSPDADHLKFRGESPGGNDEPLVLDYHRVR